MNLEIVSDAAIVDIVDQGFDAGVRFGNQVAKDMIAVPLGPSLRYTIVAAPEYVERRGRPKVSHDLIDHDCIRRRFPGGTVVTWKFEKSGQSLEVIPRGHLCLGSAQQELQAALAGIGIAHLFDDYVRDYVKQGKLVVLLRDRAQKLPSWHLH